VRRCEKLTETAELQAARTILLNEVSPPNLAFLVHHFSRSDHYFVADKRDAKYPIALDAFTRVRALDVTDTSSKPLKPAKQGC
jgi:hypothetical protein